MAQFVGKPLPDFMVKPLAGGALGAKTSLKGLAAGRPLVRSRRVRPKRRGAPSSVALPPRAFSDIGRGNRLSRRRRLDGVGVDASRERAVASTRDTSHATTQVLHFYNGG